MYATYSILFFNKKVNLNSRRFNKFIIYKMCSISFNNKRMNKFISVLVHIMNTKEYVNIISWSKDGTVIEIKNVQDLSSIVLLKCFKYTNMSNFIRQLNLYSFKKISCSNPNTLWYYNELFYKNSPIETLCQIIRNKTSKKSTMALRRKYENINAIEIEIKATKLTIKEKMIEKDIQSKLKKSQRKEIKDSFSYIKDLEALIYFSLNRPNNDNSRKVNSGFYDRIRKKMSCTRFPYSPKFAAIKKVDSIATELNHFLCTDINSFVNNEYIDQSVYSHSEIINGSNMEDFGFLKLNFLDNLSNSYGSFNMERKSSFNVINDDNYNSGKYA